MKIVSGILNATRGVIQYSVPHVKKFWYYGKVELAPPKPSEIPIIMHTFKDMLRKLQTGQWKEMKVKEVFLNGLVATEICLWFVIGECIGKRSIVGYNVRS